MGRPVKPIANKSVIPQQGVADSFVAENQASSSGGLGGEGGNLLIQWRSSVSAAQREEIHRQLGGSVIRSIQTLPMQQAGEGVLDVVQAQRGGASQEQLLRSYQQRSEVRFAEPDGTVSIKLVSNDPSYGSLWGMKSTGFGARAETAWDMTTGSARSVVGIVDTGIDYTHPDLYLNIWLNQGETKGLSFFSSLVDTDADGLITFRDLNHNTNRSNAAARLSDWNANGYIDAGDLLDNRSGWEDLIDNDGNGYQDDLIGWDFVGNDNDPFDDNSHGSHVSGTIGGIGNNSAGLAGVNWQIQMAALKFLDSTGSGSISNAVLAVDYFTTAKSGSSGRQESSLFIGTNNSWGGGGSSQAMIDAVTRASQQDLLFVAAAGNGGLDGIGDNNDLIPNYPSNYTNANVIAVAAIASDGSLASYSNYGSVSVDLGAPGSGIYSTIPGGYATYNGTSMATPMVMGAAALLKSSNPTASSSQIKQALLDSAAPTGSLSGKTVTGGRLDIAAALDLLNGTGGSIPPANLTIWGSNNNDRITGASGNDQLAGVVQSGTTLLDLGRGQIDTLTGGLGSDRFLLADSRGTFYNDGSNASQGTGDYALVTDFNATQDVLQLRSGSQYLYRYAKAATEIFLGNGDNRFNSSDELIARLNGVNLAPGTGVYVLGTTKAWTSFV